eukprot:scaffold24452_cov61-Phaeocystis_antarctica.AAC.7
MNCRRGQREASPSSCRAWGRAWGRGRRRPGRCAHGWGARVNGAVKLDHVVQQPRRCRMPGSN